jgi:Response regulator containing a CheY-like receiver domain and an HTH DNA-binding domain
MSRTKVSILLVDDHLIFTEGLKLLLTTRNDYEVIGTCQNGLEMLNFLANHQPDIVLVDINMPVLDGEEAIHKALELQPDLRIIVLTSEEKGAIVERVIHSGVKGFVSKSSCQSELVDAIETVYEGGVHFSQDIFDLLITSMRQPEKNKSVVDIFTIREKEIIRLLCDGKTSKEIAQELNINHRTVETHKAKIFEKTGVNNTISLVVCAIKDNLIKSF